MIIKKRRGPPPTGKGTLVGVRLQPAQLGALDAWIAKQNQQLTRPEAIRAMMETILHILEAGEEGEDPMKDGTLAKITASVAVAKGMAQKALAASPNPQWTEYEMQSVENGSRVRT